MSELSYKELQEQGIFDVPYRAFEFMQSQQAKIDLLEVQLKGAEERAKLTLDHKNKMVDELQARVDRVVHILTYTNHASTPLCNELRDILKGNKDD